MVLEAALVNEKVNVVGWDIAITEMVRLLSKEIGTGLGLVQVLLNKGTKYMLEE